MERQRILLTWAAVFAATVFLSSVASIDATNVTYDHRSLIIDGKRRFLQSGSIHYPRSTPQMWPQLMSYAKEGGLDVIQTYVFWNIHEPVKGTYNFAGNYDLVKFVNTVAAAGLYVHLRIGPYVCAEWNFGGFPSWLRFVPNMQLRTHNQPFEAEMSGFVTKIVNMMKDQQLFASQGGPIILAQIENEYGNIQHEYEGGAVPYIEWAAKLAESFDVGVPWVMCQQPDAPGDIINTCNGFYCDSISPQSPNSPRKPKMWTENWAGWFQYWGDPRPSRPAEDVAFAVARYFEKGGALQNYYMYHGGTNFGRTAGWKISTNYDYDAPLNEYGLPSQPKWGHLRDLHGMIKSIEPALAVVDGDPFQVVLAGSQEAHIYSDGHGSSVEEIVNSSTICAAFLSSWDSSSQDTTVQFNGQSYDLPAWSVSILPDCKIVAFNTAKVGAQKTVTKMVPTKMNESLSQTRNGSQDLQWDTYQEPAFGSWGSPFNQSGGLLEQISVTRDSSDYLSYTTSVHFPDATTGHLVVQGIGDTMHVFINGAYAGSEISDDRFTLPVKLEQGKNSITILSVTLGLQNVGAWIEREKAGIGQVLLTGNSSAAIDLSNQQWTYQVGMQGEQMALFTVAGAKRVTWRSGTTPINQALIWYKTMIDAPLGLSPVALDLGSMGQGQAWINGHSIGRFWTIQASSTCSTACNFRGVYNPSMCNSGCGEPTQRWYHVPREWLQPFNNSLVIFEETGGDPKNVSLVTQEPDRVCAKVSEGHPVASISSSRNSANSTSDHRSSVMDVLTRSPMLHLDCSPGHRISEVVFGSFGNPSGTCGSFQKGSCHSPLSAELLYLECVGRQQCFLDVSWTNFAVEDPCPDEKSRSLAIEVLCI